MTYDPIKEAIMKNFFVLIPITLVSCGDLNRSFQNNSDKPKENRERSTEVVTNVPNSQTHIPSKNTIDKNNLIHSCKGDGFALYDCVLNSKEIIKKQNEQKSFIVSYLFKDCGKEMPPIGIVDETNTSFYQFEETKETELEITLKGEGSFRIKVLDMKKFKRGFFWHECLLKINSVKDLI